MKPILTGTLLILLVNGLGFSQAKPESKRSLPLPRYSESPFGFERGMTKEQVVARLGRGAVVEERDNALFLKTAPKPQQEAHEYLVFFSPTAGLLKVVAYSAEMETSVYGEQARKRFFEFRNAVVRNYGSATSEYTLKTDLAPSSCWQFNPARRGVVAICVKVQPVSDDQHRTKVMVAYEFTGWDAYADARGAAKTAPQLDQTEGPFGLKRGMTEGQVIELVGRQAVKDSGAIKGFPSKASVNRVPLIPEEFGNTMVYDLHDPHALFPFALQDAGTVTYLQLTTAPKPYAAFESYLLKFYSQEGLLQVTAISPLIHAGVDGKELVLQYEEITSSVVSSKRGRSDLQALPEMKYDKFFSDLTWKYDLSKAKFLKGDVTLSRYWEWRCKPIHRSKKIPPSWEEDYPCWYHGLQRPPLSFFHGNRVTKITLEAGTIDGGLGRIWLTFDFEGFEYYDGTLAHRAEAYHQNH
jgi:hypothetical protein